MERKNNVVHDSIGFGSVLAIVISYTTWKSIIWAIIHGLMGWFYVIYFALRYVLNLF